MKKLIILIMILGIFLFLQAYENEYIKDIVIDENGRTLIGVIFPGQPPENYRAPIVELPDSNSENANVLYNTPAFNWSYGCSATAAAMIAGYYDRTGYHNIYTGTTNNGIIPMDNSCWPDDIITGQLRHQCPLSATRMGLDGRESFGHVDDYWHHYGSQQDPYFGNWEEHGYGECTADFMGTNQYHNSENVDAGTHFYFDYSGLPVYDYTGGAPEIIDGCHGFREFFESRGYNLQTNGNFSQVIYGYQGIIEGFTYDNFKAEIDAGRPVIIQITGHSMVNFGYDDSDEELVYIHDTWDSDNHTMIWGGTYGSFNSEHFAVSVFRLEELPTGTLYGQITDADTLLPIENAIITVGAFQCNSDADGYYVFADISFGDYDIFAAHPDHETSDTLSITIYEGTITTQDFSLNEAIPDLTILSPNGGEFLVMGESAIIRWETNVCEIIAIEFSNNAGTSWNPLVIGTSGFDEYYDWEITTSNSDQCLIKIYDISNPDIFDISDAVFSVGVLNIIGGPYACDDNSILLLHFESDLFNQSVQTDDAEVYSGNFSFQQNSIPGLGKCVQFDQDQSFSYLGVPDNDNLDLTGDWTIETWFMPTEYTTLPYLIKKMGTYDENYCNYAMRLQSTGNNQIYCFYYSNNTQNSIFEITPELNEWYHIAFIRDTSHAQLSIIIHDENRELISSTSISDNINTPLTTTKDLLLGLNYCGYLDEVRISNVVRNFIYILEADFSAEPVSGSIPLTVNFIDQSQGNITDWQWDFDNDGMWDSSEQNPTFIYEEPGVYSVSLLVSDASGTDIETKTDYILVEETGTDKIISHQTYLQQNYPNPFNPSTTISFNISRKDVERIPTFDGNVEIIIYNIKGRKIKTFSISQSEISNPNCVIWDGKDDVGKSISSGVYLYKLKAGEFTQTKKMLFIK